MRLDEMPDEDLLTSIHMLERTLCWMDGYRCAVVGGKGVDVPYDGYIMSTAHHIALANIKNVLSEELRIRHEQEQTGGKHE